MLPLRPGDSSLARRVRGAPRTSSPRPAAAFPCEAVCDRAAMSWILPIPLLLFAGVVALWPLAALVRRPTSRARLIVEAFGTTLAVIGFVWLARITLWVLEQRW